MFGNNKKNMNEMLFSMFHLRSKSHLSNSKATQLALRSNWMCKTGFGNFLTAEELSKQELYKIERDKAIQELSNSEFQYRAVANELGKFVVKPKGENDEISIIIKESDIGSIELKLFKEIISNLLGVESADPRES